MGLNIKDIVVKKEITIQKLAGKVLVVDAHNNLYQYLTTIRQRDGSPFTDAKGRVTSHLIGLFNRTTTLMEQGLFLAFVFDGKPPEIKRRTSARRKEIKIEAQRLYAEAEGKGDVESMRKYASRTAHLTPEMIEESKKVIQALGLPIIEAPSEAEAQAAHIVKMGDAYAAVSQDFDSLIFGCPLFIRNLSIEGRKKLPGSLRYTIVHPEIISLVENLNLLGVDIDQLITLAILVGTDYNPGGVKGIGPKTALKLVKEYATNREGLFQAVDWDVADGDWGEIFQTIKEMPITDHYRLEWRKPDLTRLRQLLIGDYGFSEERVVTKLNKLEELYRGAGQTGLQKWFL